MVVEERVYTIHPGKLAEYTSNYEQYGKAVQLRHLVNMVGYYATEIGPLNVVVHMWAYDDLNQRAARRAALFADAEWLDYVKRVQPLLVSQESRVMNPMPFFRAKLDAMVAAAKAVY
jgi:hypothetical protein